MTCNISQSSYDVWYDSCNVAMLPGYTQKDELIPVLQSKSKIAEFTLEIAKFCCSLFTVHHLCYSNITLSLIQSSAGDVSPHTLIISGLWSSSISFSDLAF